MENINRLLKEQNLSHFKYYEDKGRIIYMYESGTSLHIADFKRLIDVLKENHIKHNDIGLDVILIEDD
jgi:excinuclease UvrABC ATPase subunit